jgi:cation-transporting ATPase G
VLGLAAVVFVHELAEVVIIANGVRAGRTTPLSIGTTTDGQAVAPPAPVGIPS